MVLEDLSDVLIVISSGMIPGTYQTGQNSITSL